MFTRIKKPGKYQYLQIVETRREGQKTRQRVIATIGRVARLNLRSWPAPDDIRKFTLRANYLRSHHR